MGRCESCGETTIVAKALGHCRRCIIESDARVVARVSSVRKGLRERDHLPAAVPRGGALRCDRCVNACALNAGEVGFCGIRSARGGQLVGGDERAVMSWYLDTLPTNCVSAWVCPCSEERGLNLAVFCRGCAFDCLFCQNWSHREPGGRLLEVEIEELLEAVGPMVRCVCFFGGDPSPQRGFIESFSEHLRRSRPDVRVCFETNGSATTDGFDLMLELALSTGGIVKVDLKAQDERLHKALTGVTNRQTWANMERGVRAARERKETPLLVASTLLVPGYVDSEEVGALARRLAGLEPSTPYSLLAFHPAFAMVDLPRTRLAHADAARQAAEDSGMKRVRVGNHHLLW